MFSLKEDAIVDFKQAVSDMVEEHNRLTADLFNGVNEVCRHTMNARMIAQCNSFFYTYNERVVGELIPNALDKWRESEASFTEYAEVMGCGDASYEIARSIEDSLSECMDALMKFDVIQPPSTEGAEVSLADYEEIKRLSAVAGAELENIEDNGITRIDELVEGNNAFSAVRPIMVIVLKGLVSLCQALAATFSELGEQFVKNEEMQAQQSREFMERIAVRIEDGKRREQVRGEGSADFANSGDVSLPTAYEKKPKCFNELKKHADAHWANANISNTLGLIKYITDSTYKNLNKKKKDLPTEIITKLMPVYERYFKLFGADLVFSKGTPQEWEKYAKREFMGVLKERGALDYFVEETDEQIFKSHYDHTFLVFDTIARMAGKICNMAGTGADMPDYIMLSYVLYVIEAAVSVSRPTESFSNEEYDRFSKETARLIYDIIGERVPSEAASVIKDASTKRHANEEQTDGKQADDKKELEKIEDEAARYIAEHANEINELHKKYGMELMALKAELGAIKHERDSGVKFRGILRKVEEIERVTEGKLDDKMGKLTEFVSEKCFEALGGLIGIICPPLSIVGGFLKGAYDLGTSVLLADNKVEDFGANVIKKLTKNHARVYVESLALTDILKVVTQKHINIAMSYMSYLGFKETSKQTEHSLPLAFNEYIYKRYNDDKALSEALHTYCEVMIYCNNEQCILWNEVRDASVENAIYVTAIRAVLPELGYSEEKTEALINEMIRQYGFKEPEKDFKLSKYWRN